MKDLIQDTKFTVKILFNLERIRKIIFSSRYFEKNFVLLNMIICEIE